VNLRDRIKARCLDILTQERMMNTPIRRRIVEEEHSKLNKLRNSCMKEENEDLIIPIMGTTIYNGESTFHFSQ
jgi:hypothetical protein